jgi:hypothetical protein
MRRYATRIFIASFQPLKWLAKFKYRYAISNEQTSDQICNLAVQMRPGEIIGKFQKA